MSKDSLFDNIEQNRLYEISKRHNITTLVWYYLKKHGITVSPELKRKYEKECAITIYTRTQQIQAYNSIVELFNRNAIYFLPLKGIALSKYYENPELRYSCDLDILVHSKDMSRARDVLTNNGWNTDGVLHFHDMNFYKGNIHLELHFNICERMPGIDSVLADVWKYTDVEDNYELKLSNEFFMFHQVAHAYYHFLNGGCGIKALLDIKVLRDSLNFSDKLTAFLKRANIYSFYEDIISLIEYWFDDKEEPSETDLKIGKYILDGGAYGTDKNCNIIKKSEYHKNELLKKIFMPKNVLYAYYLFLDNHRFLLPVYYPGRWIMAVIHRISK